ncbi:MAG: glycosyltransferase, partial [Candidatus Nanosynbacter sp.]|nr:glycosyltransferase [Candidatus Nanosynbacter sp.]
MNSLAIIVLNWNGADDTLNCVESLQQQTLRPEIIIVDNNSSDDSVERFEDHIKSQKKDAPILIKNSQNLGFAGGINTGLVYARKQGFEYIGVLNPDAIADKKWCRALVDELSSQPKCGIATGILQRRDGKTLDTTGDFYTTWGLPGPRNRDEPVENAPSTPGEVFGATGGGEIYRAAIFD